MSKIFIFLLSVFFLISPALADEGQHHTASEETIQRKDVGICSVMREPASKDYTYSYKGKTYYFCCQMCLDKFKKEPEIYVSKIKEINLEVFQYGFLPDPVRVKSSDIVKLIITSRDVSHGVYIKEYGINVSIKKEETKKIEFIADKTGEFDIVCSVYCGPGHSGMKGKIIVEK